MRANKTDYIYLNYYIRQVMNFGKSISMSVAASGLNRKEFAKSIGVSTNYLHDLCGNRKPPSIKLLTNVSELLNINLSTLISYGENR